MHKLTESSYFRKPPSGVLGMKTSGGFRYRMCAVLTDSPDAGAYWRKLKQRLIAEGSEPVTFCHGLKLQAPDGKLRGVPRPGGDEPVSVSMKQSWQTCSPPTRG